MTTLIAVYNSEGCVGRCDARCYDAARGKCTCICGGKNHAAGKAAAMQNVAEHVGLSKDDLEHYAAIKELDAGKLAVLDTRFANMRKARETGTKRAGQLEMFCEAV